MRLALLALAVSAAACGSASARPHGQDRCLHARSSDAPADTATPSAPSSASASAPAALASASASAKDAPRLDDPRAPRLGWPLPSDCEPKRCKTASGELGLTCEDGGTCLNPCPVGLAPNPEGTFCERACKVDRDCGGGECTEEGICDAFPSFDCAHLRDCPLPDGHVGAQCMKRDPCLNPCKPGLFQAKSGDCAKPCATNADCPGGHCDDGFCGPTNALPYPWE